MARLSCCVLWKASACWAAGGARRARLGYPSGACGPGLGRGDVMRFPTRNERICAHMFAPVAPVPVALPLVPLCFFIPSVVPLLSSMLSWLGPSCYLCPFHSGLSSIVCFTSLSPTATSDPRCETPPLITMLRTLQVADKHCTRESQAR